MASTAALIAGVKEYPLERDLTIGRSGDNDIALPSRTVSRRHACLRYTEGRWFVEDLGSANGTLVNGERVAIGIRYPLRHGDRITIGSQTLVFSWPAEREDPERTETLEPPAELEAQLSPFQLQVVRCLCGAWLGGRSLDELPSNEQIAEQLGTPGATETVKAALRRAYAKAGISALPPHAKRRALCRIARQRGWI